MFQFVFPHTENFRYQNEGIIIKSPSVPLFGFYLLYIIGIEIQIGYEPVSFFRINWELYETDFKEKRGKFKEPLNLEWRNI